jgi:hypothetical protein
VRGDRWATTELNDAVVTFTVSPFTLECAARRRLTELLDTDVHGYDAEVGHGSATVRAEGERVVFECPTRGRQPLEAFVRFEYPDDLFGGELPGVAGREQELG